MPEEIIIPVGNGEKPSMVEKKSIESDPPKSEVRQEGVQEQVFEQYTKILSQVSNPIQADEKDVATDVVALAESAVSAESTIVQLVSLAETKGVVHAVAVAKKLGDYYVLDVMHDQLADKLYEALLAKGLVRAE